MELFVVCVEGVNGVTIRTVCFLLVCSVVGTFYMGKTACSIVFHRMSRYIPLYLILSNDERVYEHLIPLQYMAINLSHVPLQDVMEEYRRTGRHTKHGMELMVEMLTTGYWPTQSSPKCRLPPQAVRCCDDFVEFYLQKHTVS